MMASLNGLNALVTGAGSGIGRAIALSLADQGASVLVTDIQKAARPGGYDSDAETDTDVLIRKRGGQAEFRATDVTKAAEVEAAVAAAVTAFGRLDIMVNNAGVSTALITIVDQSEEDYDRTMAVNVKGVFLGCKYAIRQMMAQPPREGGARGRVINIASIAAESGVHLAPAYCASKGAVAALTRQLANDFGPHHIVVNAVLPGLIETAMMRAPLSDDQAVAYFRQYNTFPRFGTAEDIAGAVTFLASDAATYINGAGLVVDGGYLAL